MWYFSFDEVSIALTDDIERKVDKRKVQHEDQVGSIDKFVRPWKVLRFK
jgi:hypothetical protein